MVIDKRNENIRLILTLTETVESDSYQLKIYSPFSKSVLEVELSNDISPWPKRYNEFNVSISEFEYLQPGKYTYSIYAGEVIVESGIVTVQGETTEYISVEPNADEYLVYKKI